MSQEENSRISSSSPFDCAVCGGYVYGNNSSTRICLLCKSFFKRHAFLPANTLKCNKDGRCYIETTRRYFSSNLASCRACRLQKCLSVGMDLNFVRARSATSPTRGLMEKVFNNILINRSSLDEDVIPSNKQTSSDSDIKMNNDDMMIIRTRCFSDASDCQRRF